MTRASPPTGAGSIISATPRAATSSGGSQLPGGTPEKVTDLATDVAGFLIAPTGDRVAIWADRDMACADFNCANVARRARRARAAAASMTRPSCATGTPGRAGRALAHLHLPDGRRPAAGRGHAGRAEPGRRFAVQAVRRRRGARLEPGRPHALFHPARGGPAPSPIRPISTSIAVPADGSAAPTNLTAANRGMDTGPGRLARRPLARLHRDGAADLRGRPPGRPAAQPATGETRALTQAWDRSVGSIAWAPDGRCLLVTAGDTLDTPVFRVDVAHRPGHPAHAGRHRRQRRAAPRRLGRSTR